MTSSINAATPATPKNCLMTETPAEIRNEIFALAQMNVDAKTGERKTISMRSLVLRHKSILNKMLVSKQYLAEAVAIFWGRNIFEIEQSEVVSTANIQSGPDWANVQLGPDRAVTKGKRGFFKSIAHGNTLQVKMFGLHRYDNKSGTPDEEKPTHGYAILLPPRQYMELIKEIVLVVPVDRVNPWSSSCKETFNKAIAGGGKNVAANSWLWAVRNLTELGFSDMESVTFKFAEVDLGEEEKEAIRRFVRESDIDSKEVKVVFERRYVPY